MRLCPTARSPAALGFSPARFAVLTVLIGLCAGGEARGQQYNPIVTKNWQGGCNSLPGWHDVPGGGLPWWTFMSGCSLPSASDPLNYAGDFARWNINVSQSGLYDISVWIPNPASAKCSSVTAANIKTYTYRLARNNSSACNGSSDKTNLTTTLNQGTNLDKWVKLWSSVRLDAGAHTVILYDNYSGSTCCYDCPGTPIKLFADHLKVDKVCGDECCSGTKCNTSPTSYLMCQKIGGACYSWIQFSCPSGKQCKNGECVSVCDPAKCDDGNPCTSDYCNASDQCAHSNQSVSCNDGDPCTVSDWCSGGKCAGQPMSCNDGDACTTDSCVGGTCKYVQKGCSYLDGACQQGVCQGGSCIAQPKSGSCNDGDPCTQSDSCVGTTCTGSPMDCSWKTDACNVGICQGGSCVAQPKPGACNDGDPCTTDSCSGGACQHVPMDCSAWSDACNQGQCVSGSCTK